MKLHRYLSEMPDQRRVSWITALWAALMLLASAAVLTGHPDTAAAPKAAAVQAVAQAPADTSITPSDPEAPAASDQLPPTP